MYQERVKRETRGQQKISHYASFLLCSFQNNRAEVCFYLAVFDKRHLKEHKCKTWSRKAIFFLKFEKSQGMAVQNPNSEG